MTIGDCVCSSILMALENKQFLVTYQESSKPVTCVADICLKDLEQVKIYFYNLSACIKG